MLNYWNTHKVLLLIFHIFLNISFPTLSTSLFTLFYFFYCKSKKNLIFVHKSCNINSVKLLKILYCVFFNKISVLAKELSIFFLTSQKKITLVHFILQITNWQQNNTWFGRSCDCIGLRHFFCWFICFHWNPSNSNYYRGDTFPGIGCRSR